MHFCGFRLFGEGGARIQISDWHTKEFTIPEAQKDSDVEPVPPEMTALIEETKKVKPAWWCGLAYATDVNYFSACYPFKNGDQFE